MAYGMAWPMAWPMAYGMPWPHQVGVGMAGGGVGVALQPGYPSPPPSPLGTGARASMLPGYHPCQALESSTSATAIGQLLAFEAKLAGYPPLQRIIDSLDLLRGDLADLANLTVAVADYVALNLTVQGWQPGVISTSLHAIGLSTEARRTCTCTHTHTYICVRRACTWTCCMLHVACCMLHVGMWHVRVACRMCM